jgi:hypothetical protein
VNKPGTYILRVDGNQCAATNFTVNYTRTHGKTAGPALQPITGDFVDAQNNQVDFDGNFSIYWTPNGGEQGFEIEQSTDNTNWNIVADTTGRTTSYPFENQADGKYYFRVRSIYAGQIGQFVSAPSSVSSVLVSARTLVDITSLVSYPVSNVSFTGGVWQQDVNLISNSSQAYVPYVNFNVIGISSPFVRVINAENGGTGQNPSNPALFGFSSQLGSDQVFSPNETTGARTVKFQDTAAVMFTCDVQVTAYVGSGSGTSSSSSSSSSSQQPPSGGGGTTSILPLTKITAVNRFTVNPLTKTVTSQLIKLN